MDITGKQRISLESLKRWEALGYGMFLHFGMSTYTGNELPDGTAPVSLYNPRHLDVAQWVSVARDAGMKYAVLTTKHVAGHCLWDSKYCDYSVARAVNKADVLELFVDECRKKGIMPGFYYCSWDNRNRFGSKTPSDFLNPHTGEMPFEKAFVTREYMEFQTNQITEILTRYGELGEVWIDIPGVLPRFYRNELYDLIARLQPETIIMMNNGFGDGSVYPVHQAWPADIMAIERWLPNSQCGHKPWRTIEGQEYYIPGEVCDPIGKEWFFVDGDLPRSDRELLGMYLVCRSRNTNLLLDVPPDRSGRIPVESVEALMRLRRNIELTGGFC